MTGKHEVAAVPSLRRQKWLNDPALQSLLDLLNQRGEARVAGGAVRNALLGLPIAEVDIATNLDPPVVTDLARGQGLPVYPTGIGHGTVTVGVGGRRFEVTTLRIDAEAFGRRARVEFIDDWRADALRRDFTMNALFCDSGGRVYDFVGGYRDLRQRKVRFVGEPRRRILEDHLRILRFFRFHAWYGRGAPDAEALRQCARMRKLLSKLSAERVRGELFRLLVAPGAQAAVKAMIDVHILQAVLGGSLRFDAFKRMAEIDAAHHLAPDHLLRVECLTGCTEALAGKLKLSNAEMARLKLLRGVVPPTPRLRPRERRVVHYQLGAQTFSDAVRLAWAGDKAGTGDRPWLQPLSLRCGRQAAGFSGAGRRSDRQRHDAWSRHRTRAADARGLVAGQGLSGQAGGAGAPRMLFKRACHRAKRPSWMNPAIAPEELPDQRRGRRMQEIIVLRTEGKGAPPARN